jgi:hypothetical protein
MARLSVAAVAAAAAAAAALLSPAAAVIGKKDWSRVDFDKAEKQLEEGDDPDLVVPDDALTAREYERRKSAPLMPPEDAALK